MKNTLARSFLGSGVVLLLTVACVFALNFYKTIVPEQVERNTINITQADYAQAKATWDAQKFSAYEATSSDPRVTARLRVDRATGDMFLLSLTVEGRRENLLDSKVPLTGVTAAVYQPYTIDAIYDSIQSTLNNMSTATPPRKDSSTSFHDFDVQFDPSRGYPLHFVEKVRTTLNSREITWRTRANSIEVTDFTAVP